MQVLIATTNVGKYNEMMESLGDLPIDFVTLKDLGITQDVAEDGTTYTENAYIKARFFHQLSDLPTIAEDSGIEVNALKGELGIKTRRWGAGPEATDEEWMQHFLSRMEYEDDRRATFYSAAVFIDGDQEYDVLGAAHGQLLQYSECPMPKGIPLSAYFVPENGNKPFAAMTLAEKNTISHRIKAMQKLKKYLEKKVL